MRVLIFGAGALGGVLGAMLSRRHDVILVTRGEHLKNIQERGLRLEGIAHESIKVPAVEKITEGELFDAVFVTTKSYDTEIAAKCTAGHLVPSGIIVSVQNGIGNAETLAAHHPRESVVIGVTSLAAHRVSPGVINYVSADEIILGSLVRNSRSVSVADEILKKSGIRTRLSDNITGVIWSKAIVNAAINPLTAIHKCENGKVISDRKLNELAVAVCEEGMKVANAMKISLDPPDVVRYMTRIALNTARNRSSMLMDLERGRRTEIDAICGQILACASRLGIDCPVMARLYAEIKALESSTHERTGRRTLLTN